MEEKLIKRLITSIKCSSCRQHYKDSDIEIVGHNEDVWFLKARCSGCNTESLVVATVRQSKTPQITSDIPESELSRLSIPDIVGVDEALNMHEFLKDFNGDFYRLFGKG